MPVRDAGPRFVLPVLSGGSGFRGEAHRLVFWMGLKFWLGAELFSRLNNFVFAPRVPLSSSEAAGPFQVLLLSRSEGAERGAWSRVGRRSEAPPFRAPVSRFRFPAHPGELLPPCASSGHRPAPSCTCLVGSSNVPELQTRDPAPSAQGRRLPRLCSAL